MMIAMLVCNMVPFPLSNTHHPKKEAAYRNTCLQHDLTQFDKTSDRFLKFSAKWNRLDVVFVPFQCFLENHRTGNRI